MIRIKTTILRLLLLALLIHFTSPLFSQSCSLDSVKRNLIEDWQRLKTYTLEYIIAMPEEGISFKPTESSRSFAETMLHGAQANFIYASMVSNATNPHPFNKTGLQQNDSFKIKPALIKVMTESFDFMISNLQNMPASRFGEYVTWFKRTLTVETYVRRVFEHQVHMTGQCVIYLKLKNV